MASFRAEDPPAHRAVRDQAPIEAPRVVLGDAQVAEALARRDGVLLSSRTGRQPLRVKLSPTPKAQEGTKRPAGDAERRAVYPEQQVRPESAVKVPAGVVVQVIPAAWQVDEARREAEARAVPAVAPEGSFLDTFRRRCAMAAADEPGASS